MPAPLWAQAVAGDVGNGYSLLGKAVQNGRQWLDGFRFLWRSRASRGNSNTLLPNKYLDVREEGIIFAPRRGQGDASGSRGPFGSLQGLGSRLLAWAREGQAAHTRKETTKKLLFGGKRTGPVVALIGFTLSSKDGLLTKRDKMETLCEDVRIAVSSAWCQAQLEDLNEVIRDDQTISLKNLQLGEVIAKGCNAIVHAASWKDLDKVTVRRERTESEDSSDSGTESSIEILSSEEDARDAHFCIARDFHAQTISTERCINTVADLCQPFNGYDLAVKMMFNYDAESNAPAILSAMYKEIVPTRATSIDTQMELWNNGNRVRKKHLPPHPNIVELKGAFADSVPHLPEAMSLYPDALPRRLNRFGAGRNMTLFLVMKRYHCSLQDYFKVYNPPASTCLLLLAQLFEGIAHLVQNGVAHRDLKADNILLDLSDGIDCPGLVITDFGCCLADDNLGLKLPYYTEETTKGGNSALMAPEVASVRAGPYVSIDYRKADLWTAGALAYEIYGQPNPFYRSTNDGARLDSRTYCEDELPPLSDKAHPIIRQLVKDILQRNPNSRPNADVAANVCEILLLGPTEWMGNLPSANRPSEANIMQWLVTCAARVLVTKQFGRHNRIQQLISFNFLRRAQLNSLLTAIRYLYPLQ